MENYIGKTLDERYEILELIGTGGMANVYRARCNLLGRDVAIKILKEEFMGDKDFKKRFRNESIAVAKLAHNNIVSVYDVSKTDDIDYIVMELIDGINLKEYLTRKGSLSCKETLFFAEQITRALNHAHNRNIIHQDIKPQNIILLRDGTIKVADFGIAKIMGTNETQVINQTMGSVHYISPEQARGGTIDKTADIYSLGVVMYEMLTGRLPFDGENAISIVMKHISETPIMPSAISSLIPKAMDEIVLNCMNPIANKRYQSAAKVYRDLEIVKENPNAQLDIQNNKEDFDNTCDIKFKPTRVSDARQPVMRKKQKQELVSMKTIIMGIGIFAIIAGIASAIIMFGSSGNKKSVVPDLVGVTFIDVDLEKEYPEFIFEIEMETSNDIDVIGTITSQTPSGGEKIDKGETINLVIAESMAEELLMPSLKGLEYREALTEILGLGLSYKIERANSDEILADLVMSTNPEEGEIINEDTQVILFVSDGKKDSLIVVPDLIGLTEERAKKDLENAGLNVGNITKQEHSKNSGIVLSQSVAKEIEVAKGSKIDIVVSVKTEDTSTEEITPPDNEAIKPLGSVTMNITLPTDKEKVRVVVKNAATILYDKVHNTSEKKANITITRDKGEAMISIEIDGLPWAEELVTFK